MEAQVENARVKTTTLGVEDHGILSFFVHLEGKSWGRGFGGYGYDSHVERGVPRKGSGLLAEHVRGILECLAVESWEKLPGTVCRVKRESFNGPLLAIGHVIDDRWFSLTTGRDGRDWAGR